MTAFRTIAAASTLLALGGCELGTKVSEQTGYRGTGMEQIRDVSLVKAAAQVPPPPYPLEISPGSRPAREVYQNVQVLGGLNEDEFNHLMAAITQWVAPPEQGCNYCHNPENMADDNVYTKIVARSMLKMTLAANGQWVNHTGKTGVTCYTCHRGNAVPAYFWTREVPGDRLAVRGQKRGQNTPLASVGYTSLPHDIFERYFAGDPSAIRVASSSPYPGLDGMTTRNAEDSYGIMMHVSQALGVNCTYCHNSQSFRSWSLSRPQRATAWYGINMVRDMNEGYIAPLANVLPANRKGPAGDPFKVNCLTCHQGAAKPMGGVSMIADYPYLRAVHQDVAAAAPAASGVPAALADPRELTSDISPPNAPATEANATGSPLPGQQ